MSADLLAKARAWLLADPDPATREELEALLDRAEAGDEGALSELSSRFAGPLEFGTAGLRGVLGAGESRLNLAVVLRTTFGLGTVLLEDPSAKWRGVAVGFDARRGSRRFAEAAAEVLAAMGIPATLAVELTPTPLVAFAAKHAGALAGVVVTASHNPPEYNGYKVYGPSASQIVPPLDEKIAAAIAEAPPARDVPRLSLETARAQGLVRTLGDELERAYLDGLATLVPRADVPRDFPIVYTPLHGVGHRLLRRALEGLGYSRLVTVPEQAEPDGAFPTVAFPNPEEQGALDLAIARAREVGAELVIANDPDADRLAVCVRAGDGYVQLTGNQVGVLLGHFVLDECTKGDDRLVVSTVVSSPLLGVVARGLGARFAETLTGFKWITHEAMALEERERLRFVFGYEEALGYTVGTLVRDKDGIGAAIVLLELAARCRARGRDLLGELERIHRRFGLFVSRQRSIGVGGADAPRRMAALVESLRREPPTSLGGLAVTARVDRKTGERTLADGSVTALSGPASDVLSFELAGSSRVVVRPSGTEPKVKVYVDVSEPVAEGEPMADAEARASTKAAALMADLSRILGI